MRSHTYPALRWKKSTKILRSLHTVSIDIRDLMKMKLFVLLFFFGLFIFAFIGSVGGTLG